MLARFGLERRRWRQRISDTQRQWRQAAVIYARVLGLAMIISDMQHARITYSGP